MRTVLRLAALFVALVTLVLWFFGGPNLGRTKTTVTMTTIDSITNHERIHLENRFLPGVDFLGGGILVGIAFFAVSFRFAK